MRSGNDALVERVILLIISRRSSTQLTFPKACDKKCPYGKKGGPCPQFCGQGGLCCKRGAVSQDPALEKKSDAHWGLLRYAKGDGVENVCIKQCTAEESQKMIANHLGAPRISEWKDMVGGCGQAISEGRAPTHRVIKNLSTQSHTHLLTYPRPPRTVDPRGRHLPLRYAKGDGVSQQSAIRHGVTCIRYCMMAPSLVFGAG